MHIASFSNVKAGFYFFLFAFLLSGCLTPEKKHYPLHSSLENKQLPTLISIDDFCDYKKDKFNYKISPDAKKIAWIETIRGTQTVHFKSFEENKVRYISTLRRRISNFHWAQDSQRIFVYYGNKGKENYNIGTYNTEAPGHRPFFLVDFKGHMKYKKRAFIQQSLINDPEHVFVIHNDRDLSCYDLYKVNIKKRDETLIAKNPGDVTEWITDHTGKLHARIRNDEKAKTKYLEAFEPETTTWRKVIKLDIEDTFDIIGFDKPTGKMWALSNRNRDKIALVKFPTKTGKEQLVYEHPKVDIDSYELIRKSQEPYLLYLEPDYPMVHFIKPQMKEKFRPFLDRINKDNYDFFYEKSADNRTEIFTLVAYSDKEWSCYLFDSIAGKVELLHRSWNSKYKNQIPDMKPISFKSRDGLEINGYLTLPLTVQPNNLPIVILVHGGPWSRYSWGIDQEVQFLTNRGYAVLQINFRGSKGYGRQFMEAAIGEYGGKMNVDLIDGALWAIDQKIADPKKIAIYGASYGGYATLIGLTSTPDFYACGIDVFGPSDLEALIDEKPVWWKLGMHRYYKYIGNPDNPEDLKSIKARSPINKVDAIQRPLLIIHGSEDPRVPQKHSSKIIEKLKNLKKDFEYHIFSDEGHGIHRENRITYYEIIDKFLAKHLGGRSEE